MIAQELVDEIRRLLSEGRLSQRQIARELHVSRGTVGGIANGTRRDRPPRRPDWADDPLAPTGPLRRCPTCGGLAYLPCRLCGLRARLAESPLPGFAGRPDAKA
jgi:DNA-binding XRE family transcriptional regulator